MSPTRVAATNRLTWLYTRSNLSPQRVAATSRLTCTRSDLSPQRVAATSRLTCTQGVICRRNVLLQLVSLCVPTFTYFNLPYRCAMGAVICYWDDYLDVVGPTMDTIRYPFRINKIILYMQLAFQLFAGQAI